VARNESESRRGRDVIAASRGNLEAQLPIRARGHRPVVLPAEID